MSAPTLTFSPAMFHAAHVARIKTVTRRLIKGLDAKAIEQFVTRAHDGRQLARLHSGSLVDFGPPAHRPGETKPMVTTWAVHKRWDNAKPSDLASHNYSGGIWFDDGSEKPSWAGRSMAGRHLPKTLYHLAPRCRIESARPEPLLDLTEPEALAEGIQPIGDKFGVPDHAGHFLYQANAAGHAYFRLWDFLHPKNPSHTNPIVWRYQFTPL